MISLRRLINYSPGLILLLALLVYSQTSDRIPRNQNPVPERGTGQPFIVSNASVISVHDDQSPRYNPNCLSQGCHADIFNRVTLNASIREAHQIVELMGITATNCRFCHESVEIVSGMRQGRGNAGNVGKNVNPGFKCAPCHGPYGIAKPLYVR